MEARTTAERPPRHPGPNGFVLAKQGGNSYVHRFKIQKERIKTLHDTDKNSSSTHKTEKTLPKLPKPFVRGIPREDTGVRKFTRSNTIVSVKLPGVSSGSAYAQAAKRKEPLPVKTFHLRLNPEHTSLLSKSLPSLPSIPGSPSQEFDAESYTDRPREFKSSVFPGRHRFQKIAFQKTIHSEKPPQVIDETPRSNNAETKGKSQYHFESVYNNVLPQRAHKHQIKNSAFDGYSERGEPPKSNSTLSHKRHHSRRLSKESAISETRSEDGYIMNKKWKDNCNCLRCQMLRRQYQEGDEHYKLWGQYPCHRVDMNVSLDDDD